MQSKLESFDIEDLRNTARLNGLKRYSYKELLTDFLLINLDHDEIRELITEHEEYQKNFREYLGYLTKRELINEAYKRDIKGYSNMNKSQLIEAILGYRINRRIGEMSYEMMPSESLLDELNEPLATKTRKTKPRKTKAKRTSPRRNTRSKKELRNFTVKELKSIAKERGLKGYSRLNKESLVNLLSKR